MTQLALRRDHAQHRHGAVLRVVTLAGFALALVLACALSLRYGARPISWHDVVTALAHYRPPERGSDGFVVDVPSANAYSVHDLWLPRTVLGVCAGAAFGVAGALMQGLTRNPLADPHLLGINSGAGLGISLALVVGVDSFSTYVWWGLAGAAIAGVAVYGLATIAGGATPLTLALGGAVLAAFIGGLTNVLALGRPDLRLILRFWGAGSIGGANFPQCLQILPFLAVGLLLAIGLPRSLNGLSLGDDVARSLGQHVVRTRLAVACAVVCLAGSAVAVCGPIVFVGLMVPHIARWTLGPDYRWIVPASAVLGAFAVVAGDTAGRVIDRPGEVSVGIVLGVLGAPFFIFLARRRTLELL